MNDMEKLKYEKYEIDENGMYLKVLKINLDIEGQIDLTKCLRILIHEAGIGLKIISVKIKDTILVIEYRDNVLGMKKSDVKTTQIYV